MRRVSCSLHLVSSLVISLFLIAPPAMSPATPPATLVSTCSSCKLSCFSCLPRYLRALIMPALEKQAIEGLIPRMERVLAKVEGEGEGQCMCLCVFCLTGM